MKRPNSLYSQVRRQKKINLDEVKLARDKIPSLQHDRKFDLIIDKKKIVA